MSRLEENITQAQNREGQILDMTQWMTEMNDLLQSRLDADIVAGDVPDEYEVTSADSDVMLIHFPLFSGSVIYIGCCFIQLLFKAAKSTVCYHSSFLLRMVRWCMFRTFVCISLCKFG